VLVLVENRELAQSLAGQLPDWSLKAGHEVAAEQVLKIHQIPSPARTGPVHVIATVDALGVDDLSEFDVLIRVDGRIEPPRCIPSNFAERACGVPRPLVIVDCGGWNHPSLGGWTKRRMEAYEERGWLAPGRDPFLFRVERFVAGRPRKRIR
jgi:hypothetical protein